MLIEQTYPGPDDDLAHFASLRAAFEDSRYVRVGGRPVFFVYQPGDLPEPAGFVERWQKMAYDAGLGGLYLVASLGESPYRTHVEDGFDAAVHYRYPFERTLTTKVRDRLIARRLAPGPRRYPYAQALAGPPAGLGGTLFPSVYPNWDNTPRSERRGVVATGSTPDAFAHHLRQAFARASELPSGQQVVMIKSWNEWAEGNYLEPDAEFGHGWLEALQREAGRAGVLR